MRIIPKWRRAADLLVFVAPALLFYAVFVLASAGGGLWYSLTDWNGLARSYRLVGLANYVEALTNDPPFLKSILFTLRYVVCMVVLQNASALLLAVFIESRARGRSFFRTVFFMPNMLSMIVGGFMWMFIFTRVLPFVGTHSALRFLDRSWIGDPRFALGAILVTSLWGGVGYLMVIYIAALQSIPRELREAAAIDGARALQVFARVTVPLILPAVTIGIFVSLNSSFKVFDVVYALTGGGPGRQTQVIALNIYVEAFSRSYRYGYASAKAIVLFLIVFLITLLQLRIMKGRELEV